MSAWDKAEKALEEALNTKGLDWELQPGEGAFYGPKIEFSLKDCLDGSGSGHHTGGFLHAGRLVPVMCRGWQQAGAGDAASCNSGFAGAFYRHSD